MPKYVTFNFSNGVNKPSFTPSEALAYSWATRGEARGIIDKLDSINFGAVDIEPYQDPNHDGRRRYRLRAVELPPLNRPGAESIPDGCSNGRQFKMRAECRGDVFALLNQITSLELVRLELDSDPLGLPDVVVVLTLRTLTLPELKTVLGKIPDSHVMLETVATPDQYTGERFA